MSIKVVHDAAHQDAVTALALPTPAKHRRNPLERQPLLDVPLDADAPPAGVTSHGEHARRADPAYLGHLTSGHSARGPSLECVPGRGGLRPQDKMCEGAEQLRVLLCIDGKHSTRTG